MNGERKEAPDIGAEPTCVISLVEPVKNKSIKEGGGEMDEFDEERCVSPPPSLCMCVCCPYMTMDWQLQQLISAGRNPRYSQCVSEE